MPYIVTTKRELQYWPAHMAKPAPQSVSRRAVATLEEAQSVAHIALQNAYGPGALVPAKWTLDLVGFPESGGTVGPLPDGTVIEVEQVTTAELRRGLALDAASLPQIIDAYNARQS